jgi:hypothetical protein
MGSVIVTGEFGVVLFVETVGGDKVGVILLTVTGVAGETAALLFASADVAAVMESLPSGREDVVIAAAPLTTVADPRGVVPLKNVTVPVTPGGTVSVIVSGEPTGRLEEETAGGGNTGVDLLTTCVSVALAELLFESPL